MNFSEFKTKYQRKEVIQYENSVESAPLVSVCIQTYQHAPYIADCLESILMQRTVFNFEILLGEDASKDGTREICVSYAKKYPEKVRLFLHSRENNIEINGSPSGRFNFLYNLYSANGKYIAICEGDDSWTDPFKLQKQVDFLKQHQTYSIHHHNYDIYDNRGEYIGEGRPKAEIFDLNDYLSGRATRMPQTCTLLFRRPCDISKIIINGIYICDTVLVTQLLRDGSKAYYSTDKMAIYRKHSGGVWSLKSDCNKAFHKGQVFESLIKLNFNNRYIYRIYESLISTNITLIKCSSSRRLRISFFVKNLKALLSFNYLLKAPSEKGFILRYLKLFLQTSFHFFKPF